MSQKTSLADYRLAAVYSDKAELVVLSSSFQSTFFVAPSLPVLSLSNLEEFRKIKEYLEIRKTPNEKEFRNGIKLSG